MRRRALVLIITLSFLGLIAPVVLANVKPDYWLPYDYNVGRKVSQGNGGTGTHKDQPDLYAWDFSLPGQGGWVIRAARGGTIVGKLETEEDNHCPPVQDAQGNFVRIDHGDGFESLYYHLRPNTVPQNVGDKVRRYSNVGLVGDTGNACGEHLHYQVQPDGCAPSVDFCGNSVPSSFVDDTVPSNGVPTVIPSPTLIARNHPPDRLLRRDGNRKTEVLKTTGVQWQVTFSGQGAWSTVGSSPDVVGGITLGDFNNDGKTDAFKTVGSTGNCAGLGPGWKVSYSRPNNPPDAVDTFGIWGHLNCSSAGMSTLAFGDFDGDGKMDVFTTVTGACGSNTWNWLVSYGGTSSWATVNCSSVGFSALAFADFNGDGKTDVFTNVGTGACGSRRWDISYGATGSWTTVNCSSAVFADMAFRDFDNDGQTDVFNASGSVWHRIDGGIGSWIWMRDTSERVSTLGFGDFDGNGYTDVFSPSDPEDDTWLVSYSGTNAWTTLNLKPELLPELLLGMRDRG